MSVLKKPLKAMNMMNFLCACLFEDTFWTNLRCKCIKVLSEHVPKATWLKAINFDIC